MSSDLNAPKQPIIVCLCGSTRFKQAFIAANRTETLAGKIVLSVGMFGHDEGIDMDGPVKKMLDELHLRKIDRADEVLVLNCRDGDCQQPELLAAAHHCPECLARERDEEIAERERLEAEVDRLKYEVARLRDELQHRDMERAGMRQDINDLLEALKPLADAVEEVYYDGHSSDATCIHGIDRSDIEHARKVRGRFFP